MRIKSRSMRTAAGSALLLSFAGTGMAQTYTLPREQPIQRLAAADYPRAQRLDELHAILAH